MAAAKETHLEVVAAQPLQDHSDPAFPKVIQTGEKATFPRDEALKLIEQGAALRVKDVPKNADPAELAAIAATTTGKGAST